MSHEARTRTYSKVATQRDRGDIGSIRDGRLTSARRIRGTYTREQAERDAREELSDKEHLNTLGEKDQKDKACQSGETNLKRATVAEAVLSPTRDKDTTTRQSALSYTHIKQPKVDA
jgi:hypothetical protein